MSIDEDILFKYNSSNEYYNDKCFPYTTENDTDIIIEDRRNEYINNNLSLCESNCEYNGYDIESKRVSCKCNIKINIPLFSEIIIDKNKLKNNFIDIKSTINIYVIKCYKLLFTKGGIKYNFGSYIIFAIILIQIISLFIFVIKGYHLFKAKIYQKWANKNKKEKLINTINLKNKSKKKKNPPKKIKEKKKKNKKLKLSTKLKSNKHTIYKANNELVNNSNFLFFPKKINKKKDNQLLNKPLIEYNDYELNNLDYSVALKIDKRSYFQYYLSLLRTKHLLIFTFYTNNDYNSKIIKISLFFFSFALYYTVNVLFFTDSTMHKIYEDKGSFNFIYHIPQIIYSTAISSIIYSIVSFLSLSQNNIIQIKSEKNKKSKEIMKCLLIKFFVFIY